jgi:hypothetical protein
MTVIEQPPLSLNGQRPPPRWKRRAGQLRALGSRGARNVRAIGIRWKLSRTAPGIYAALGISLGLAGIIGHVFGHGLAPWCFLLFTGLFALRLDNRLPGGRG